MVEHAEQLPVAGAVLTQFEEATSLGAVLGILVAHELPVAGVTDADNTEIAQITAEGLINQSKRMARRILDRKNQQLKVAV